MEKSYKIKTRTKAFNKPGLSPTEKDGTDMGWVETSFPAFTPVGNINGWLAIASNKWVMLSACELVTAPPPTESAFVSATLTRADGTTVEFVPKV